MTGIYRVFKLIAIALCCVFVTTGSQASVCFVPNGDCGGDTVFGNTDNLDDALDKRCQEAGYDKTVCGTEDIKYQCPYKSTQLMCCNKKYHYEGCIYPLEIDNPNGKCGTRYACRCPSEYEVSSADAEKNNCQPGGGYCMANDGVTDTIKYKTCTCDRTIYKTKGSCKNNQKEAGSCTQLTGADKGTYTNCYCDQSDYPKTSCEYGGKGGSCTDANSGRTYYEDCKTAEEACEDEGYYNDCPTRTTYTTTTSATCYKGAGYSYACENGNRCPYHPDYFKCVFSVKSYCENLGYTVEDTSKSSGVACTDNYGVQGTREYCAKGPSYSGKYYYKCKVTCKDQIKAAVSRGELVTNSSLAHLDGSFAVERVDAGGKRHLYLLGDVGIPKKSIGSNMYWTNASVANAPQNYSSVNGFNALYDVDKTKYSACNDDRYSSNYPTLYISHKWMTATNYFLDVDLSDLKIHFVMNSGDGDGSEYYEIKSNHTWKNVTFSEANVDKTTLQNLGLTADSGQMRTSSKKNDWDNVVYDDNRSKIHFNNSVTVVMTGNMNFYMGSYQFSDYANNVTQYYGFTSYVEFHMGSHAQVVFDNATLYAYTGMDWDGADHSTMIFKNSTGTIGKVWSQWNIGLLNSDIGFTTIHIDGWNNDKVNASLGGTFSSSICKYTPGVYLKNSRITIGKAYYSSTYPFAMLLRSDDASARLYISQDSQALLHGPIVMNKNVAVCFPNANAFLPKTEGGNYSGYRLASKSTGTALSYYTYESSSSDYLTRYYRAKGGNACAPLNLGRCTNANDNKRFTTMGSANSANTSNWGDGVEYNKTPTYKPSEKNGYLYSACYNFQYCGLGYEAY